MKKTSFLPLRAPVALAAAAVTDGTGVDVSDFQGVVKVHLNSTAMGGTVTPTGATKLQHSVDNTNNWEDVVGGAFADVTTVASSQELMFNADKLRKYVRVRSTITGTNPTQTFSVVMAGVKQSV